MTSSKGARQSVQMEEDLIIAIASRSRLISDDSSICDPRSLASLYLLLWQFLNRFNAELHETTRRNMDVRHDFHPHG